MKMITFNEKNIYYHDDFVRLSVFTQLSLLEKYAKKLERKRLEILRVHHSICDNKGTVK